GARPRPESSEIRSPRSGRSPGAGAARATTGSGRRPGARGPGTPRGSGPSRWRRWWSSRHALARRLAGGDLFPDPVIALPLELEGQLLATGLHDLAVEEHVDLVRLDVLQEPLIVRHQDHRVVGLPQAVHALRDGLERVDVEARVRLVQNGELRLEHRHLEDLIPFLLAAGEALVDGPIDEAPIHVDDSELLVQELQKLHGVELLLPLPAAPLVDRSLEEVGVAHARDLHRVLEGQEQPRARPLLSGHREQVLPEIRDLARRHDVARMARQHLGQRALAGPVRTHDRVHLTRLHLQADALEDVRPVLDARTQTADRQHQPMLPSKLTPSSFVASTANSIGRFLKTSLQKPLMIIDTALSPEIPRCLQ